MPIYDKLANEFYFPIMTSLVHQIQNPVDNFFENSNFFIRITLRMALMERKSSNEDKEPSLLSKLLCTSLDETKC